MMVWFFLGYALFAAVYLTARSSERRLALDEVCRDFGGRRVEGWFRSPGFTFMVDGVDGEFTTRADGRGNGLTRVLFRHAAEGRLELSREGILSRLFESSDLKIGDDAFDRAWLLYGAPVRWIHGVLDPATRARIERLALRGSGMFHPAGLKITADRDGVVIAVPRSFLGDAREMRGFLEDSIAILRSVRGVHETPAGIAFLGETRTAVSGRCPLCEHALGVDVRFCARCRTPHHDDCWDYFGGCTVYACGGRVNEARGPSTRAGGR